MYLKMHIGNILIAKYEIEFIDMSTTDERQSHLELLATSMYWEHYKKIQLTKTEPVFYVDHVQSKMNDLTYLEEQELFGKYLTK